MLSPGGRIVYKARAALAQLRYDADARFQGVSLEQNLNRNITTFGADAQLSLTPLSSASLAVSGFRDRFLFAPDRDGDGVNVMAGAAFSPRALLSGRAEVGYLGYTTVQTGTQYGGPAYRSRSVIRAVTRVRRRVRQTIDTDQLRPRKGVLRLERDGGVFDIDAGLRLGGLWSGRSARPDAQGSARRAGAVSWHRELQGRVSAPIRRGHEGGTDVERYVTGGPGGFRACESPYSPSPAPRACNASIGRCRRIRCTALLSASSERPSPPWWLACLCWTGWADQAYHVGHGDVLKVAVGATGAQWTVHRGRVGRHQHALDWPGARRRPAIDEIRTRLRALFADGSEEPAGRDDVAEFKSQPFFVVGEVTPGSRAAVRDADPG